jgi:hypothetical protein
MTSEKAKLPIGVVVINNRTTKKKWKIYKKCMYSEQTVKEWREDYSKSIIYQGPCFMCEHSRGEEKLPYLNGGIAPWKDPNKLINPNVVEFLTNSERKIVLNPKKSITPISALINDKFDEAVPHKQIRIETVCDACMKNNDWFITLKKMYPPESDCTFVDLRG